MAIDLEEARLDGDSRLVHAHEPLHLEVVQAKEEYSWHHALQVKPRVLYYLGIQSDQLDQGLVIEQG